MAITLAGSVKEAPVMARKQHQSTRRAPTRSRTPKKLTTAIARRPAAPVIPLPPAGVIDVPGRTLGDDTAIGSLGLTPMKFTAEENAVLDRPVAVDDIRIKPTGQPYLSHPTYYRWLNDAFGRGEWSLVPVSKPIKTDKGVARDFVLYVHGKPVAHAMGEQDYHEDNRDQSWADALEACYGNALRRCCKRLGIGLELWDREFLDSFVAEHCVLVAVRRRGEIKRMWRRVQDPKFGGEVGAATDEADEREAPPQRSQRPAYDTSGQDRRRGEPITAAQVGRLEVIIRNSGRMPDAVMAWLKQRHGVTALAQIQKGAYDGIWKAIESAEALR